jgi:hypothetical protein
MIGAAAGAIGLWYNSPPPRRRLEMKQQERHPGIRNIRGRLLDRLGGISLAPNHYGLFKHRLTGDLIRHPWLLVRLALKVMRSGSPAHFLFSLLRGKAHPVNIYMHNFTSAVQASSAATDLTVPSRLQACVFKGAVKQNGEWEAVPMCSMNQVRWREIPAERMRAGAGRPD